MTCVFFWCKFKDLGQVLRHINIYLSLCEVVQLHYQLIVHLPFVYGEVCILSVLLNKLVSNSFYRVASHVGYFYIVNMPHYSELLAIQYFVGHKPIIWVYFKSQILQSIF